MSSWYLKTRALQAFSSQGQPLTPTVDIELKNGEVLILTGDNGSGKSTLIKTLLKRHLVTKGDMSWNCPLTDIEYLPQMGTLAFHIPFSLQDLIPTQTKSNLLSGLDLTKQWNTASGGERQRVLLAAALAKNPKVLVLDEPFNHVDQSTAFLLEQNLVAFMSENPDRALIMVSHRPLALNWPQAHTLEL